MFGIHSGTISGEFSPNSSKFLAFSSRTQSSLCTVLLPAAPKMHHWQCPACSNLGFSISVLLFLLSRRVRICHSPQPWRVPAVPGAGAPCTCPGREDSLEVHRGLCSHHTISTFQRTTIKAKALWHPGALDPYRGALVSPGSLGTQLTLLVPQLPPYP